MYHLKMVTEDITNTTNTTKRRLSEMTAVEVIKAMLKEKGETQSSIAEKMGYGKATAVNNMLSRGNMTVDTILEMCEIMGYEITVQPKRIKGARPSGQMVIDEESKPKEEKGQMKRRVANKGNAEEN